jgi:hypothetical protein
MDAPAILPVAKAYRATKVRQTSGGVMDRKKSPSSSTPPKQLESLIKSYALKRLQETPGVANKPVKPKKTKKNLRKG